ncbi:hypothetical protein BKA64DRAFT_660914 [Cadophora sp. MPI-SDFR-AT-0126]|nr:hypothetical protein BKA64DRAFT_660914 [Leotiomycetes sp. MPI-SDFR-AT-0126]
MGGGPEIPHKHVRTEDRSTTISASANSKEYTVLVTGMGAYPDGLGGHYSASDNTSHLITQHLPSHIPASHPLNPTNLPIRILNPTSGPNSAVKTEYAYIRSYTKTLHAESQKTNNLDAIVHLGMADGWEWYTVEERAFKEGMSSTWWGESAKEGYYMVLDDAGETVLDIKGEDEGMWKGSPMGLVTGVDVEKVVGDAKRAVNAEDEEKLKIQIIPHFEAGNYGCGFIYYESLATCLKRKLDTKVVFCHVPGWRDEMRLKRGADVVCAIIGAICDQIPKGNDWYPVPPPLPSFPHRLA